MSEQMSEGIELGTRKPALFDSHCHLDESRYPEGVAAVVTRARAAGVSRMVTIGGGDSVDYARAAVQTAHRFEEVWATVGIHPHAANQCSDAVMTEILELARDERVVGIGETGLDYYYDTAPKAAQREAFVRHIHLAATIDKPLVVHVRDAFDDCLEILKSEAAGVPTLIHCFSGTLAEADLALALGCWLAIPGIVTFKRPGELPEVVRRCPADRLLLETDSPFLAPMPKRGKPNEPAHITFTAAKVAALRETSLEALAALTTQNALAFYGIQ